MNQDERLISELKKVSGARTKTGAIHIVAREVISRRTVERIKALSGKVPLVDN